MFFEQNHLLEQFSKTKTSSTHLKMDPEKNEKSINEPSNVSYAPSSEDVQAIKQSRLQYLKWYFTSKEGWIGDYVSSFLETFF
jgi:hypothetical protein